VRHTGTGCKGGRLRTLPRPRRTEYQKIQRHADS
jgi:hypothetical protein